MKKASAKEIDAKIKEWLASGERFDDRRIGKSLYLRFRKADSEPNWRFRYSMGKSTSWVTIGFYPLISRVEAEKQAKILTAKVLMGEDVLTGHRKKRMALKQEREMERKQLTIGAMADLYYEKVIVGGRIKHPQIVRSQIERNIRPHLGKTPAAQATTADIDNMLTAIKGRGAKTMANKALRLIKRIYDYGIRHGLVQNNPTATLEIADAGGLETPRDRALSTQEITTLFKAMRRAQGFSIENYLTIKLLMMLPVRKMELAAARWDEFDLEQGVWRLHGNRTKKGHSTDIPLAPEAIEALLELKRLALNSEWVLPARKMQNRMLPHICESTLSVALAKVKHGLEPFTIHDLRRTARSHLARLKVPPHIARTCLNHKAKGVDGIYDRYTYFEERKDALGLLAKFIVSCEIASESNQLAA